MRASTNTILNNNSNSDNNNNNKNNNNNIMTIIDLLSNIHSSPYNYTDTNIFIGSI